MKGLSILATILLLLFADYLASCLRRSGTLPFNTGPNASETSFTRSQPHSPARVSYL